MSGHTNALPLTEKPFYTIADLVKMGVSRASWYNYQKAGRITFRKMAGRTVCLRADLEAFLSNLPEAG